MKPTVSTSVTVQEVADEVLVLNRTSNQLHHLNATASWIFHRCDGTSSLRSMLDQMMEHFDVERSVAADDLLKTLDTLRRSGLVETGTCADLESLAQELQVESSG